MAAERAAKPTRGSCGAIVLTALLGVLGALVLLFAIGRPSIGRFLAAGLLIGAAAFVRRHDLHRNDPGRYSRGAQIRSVVWSLVIVAVFVGASWGLTELLGSG